MSEYSENITEIERTVADATCETAGRQSALRDRCLLSDYAGLARSDSEGTVWTEALQKALDEHEIVEIPPQTEKYFLDRTVIIPSNRRIVATGATLRMHSSLNTILFRNRNAQDGTLRPLDAARRDDNIAIIGGRWEDHCEKRQGYGTSGRYDMTERRHGNFYGVSTMFFFSNCDHITMENVTIAHTGGFAVQVGDSDADVFRNIRFDCCYADGLHLNGNLTRILVDDVRGQVGDDLVALNAYDWLDSSVNFGPQRYVLCQNLELVHLPGQHVYPAIRMQPAKYKYADGSVVDCALSDIVFRNVKGIQTFKMYLQTPRYRIGTSPEWAEIGSGGNIFFENIDIDLTAPIDNIGQYRDSEPLRGHFGAFEMCADLSAVFFKDIRIKFHLDKFPLAHLLTVGPKSIFFPDADGKGGCEIFDPYVSCVVKKVTVENLQCSGEKPRELVHTTVFEDINRDGHSSGQGVIEEVVFA